MVSPLNPRHFERYAKTLLIESKDEGLVPFKMRQSQVCILKGITKALENNQRQIYLLKSRQIGASTIGLGMDLYWPQLHPGIHGTLITDTDSNREQFRTTLSGMLGNPTKATDSVLLKHNKEHLVFKNRSRLIYQVAGIKESGNLGRGKGLNYCHATEVSSWGNAQSVESLYKSFSEKNPNRFYLFESTARGFNLWYDMCKQAQRSRSQCFLFVTWWHSPEFQIAKGTNEFRVYGQEEPTPEEREWMRQIEVMYGHKITKQQLAWWRFKIEDEGNSLDSMMEDYPPTEEHAWVMTGAQFFSTESLTRMMITSREYRPKGYIYNFGSKFEELERRQSEVSDPQILIWEEPKQGAYYAIGADPCGGAGGSSGDDAVIEVLRCFGDGVEQVAEFRTPGIPGYLFAWVLAKLAAEYQPCVANIEINGAGIAVVDELSRLDFQGSYYLYRRIDSLGGSGFLHWRTNSDNKRWVMEQLRTVVELNHIDVRSPVAVGQLRKIEQMGTYIGGSSAKTGDDCVMGLALAVEAWAKQYMEMLKASHIVRPKRDEKGVLIDAPLNVVSSQVQKLMKDAGFRPADDNMLSVHGEGFFAGITDDQEQF